MKIASTAAMTMTMTSLTDIIWSSELASAADEGPLIDPEKETTTRALSWMHPDIGGSQMARAAIVCGYAEPDGSWRWEKSVVAWISPVPSIVKSLRET